MYSVPTHQEVVSKCLVAQPVAAEGDDGPQKGLRQGRLTPACQKSSVACSALEISALEPGWMAERATEHTACFQGAAARSEEV